MYDFGCLCHILPPIKLHICTRQTSSAWPSSRPGRFLSNCIRFGWMFGCGRRRHWPGSDQWGGWPWSGRHQGGGGWRTVSHPWKDIREQLVHLSIGMSDPQTKWYTRNATLSCGVIRWDETVTKPKISFWLSENLLQPTRMVHFNWVSRATYLR